MVSLHFWFRGYIMDNCQGYILKLRTGEDTHTFIEIVIYIYIYIYVIKKILIRNIWRKEALYEGAVVCTIIVQNCEKTDWSTVFIEWHRWILNIYIYIYIERERQRERERERFLVDLTRWWKIDGKMDILKTQTTNSVQNISFCFIDRTFQLEKK